MRFQLAVLYVFVLLVSLIITILSDKKLTVAQRQKFKENEYNVASNKSDYYLKELPPEKNGDMALNKEDIAWNEKLKDTVHYAAYQNPNIFNDNRELEPYYSMRASYHWVSSPSSGESEAFVSAAPNPSPAKQDIIEAFIYSYRPYAIFISMIVGMFCFQMYNSFQKYEKNGKMVPFMKVFIESALGAKFLMAVVVSPIVFMTIRSLVDGVNDSTVCCFISFQNGFFWITAFDSISKRAMICKTAEGSKNNGRVDV